MVTAGTAALASAARATDASQDGGSTGERRGAMAISGARIALGAARLPLVGKRPLPEAALDADATAAPAGDLASLWQDLMDRRLNVSSAGSGPRREHVLTRTAAEPGTLSGPLSRIETAVLVRVLYGEQQKAVASELGIACSTASKWYTRALAKMHLTGGPIPLPLVIAAQAWASGQRPPVNARFAAFDHEGARYFVLSVPKPAIPEPAWLTPAECEVARLLAEGESRWEIAARRGTSAQTVACQIRGIFAKWRLTGRYALIRRAVDLGWFR
jgi:DNA-binding NarL/FixJ family response regulator